MAAKWTTVTFGEVVTLAQGLCFNAKSNHLMAETGIPLLRIADLINNTQTKFVDAERVPKKYISNPKDIIYTRTGQVGLVFKGKVGVVHNNCFRVIPQDGVEADYVYWYLTQPSVIEKARALAGGAAQPDLGHDAFKSISFTYPEPKVQRRIAGILSAYDELMENSQRRIRLLEAMARALYREWFVHFRFPGHEKHPRVASPLGDIPQGWEVKRIGEVADTFRGRSYRSVDLAEEGGLPFLNLKCLDRDGGFRRSGLKRYTGEYKSSHVAKKGDIVMGVTDMTQERRIVARAALVPTLDNEFGIASMDLVRIEPKPPMPKAFLYAFLRYSSFADEVKQHANGANVLHLAPERITDFKFPVPPADLTRRFAAFVAPTLEQMDKLQNKIENLRHTRDLLLPRLLSGQVELKTEEVQA